MKLAMGKLLVTFLKELELELEMNQNTIELSTAKFRAIEAKIGTF